MKILIVDDEQSFLTELRRIISRICRENGITADISVTDDAESLVNGGGKQYDVILLDIEMPKLSGLDLAEKLNAVRNGSDKPFIIFVTNREGLVFEALRQQPYSFIRKSHPEDLAPCLIRLNEKCEEEYLTVKSGRSTDKVALRELIYLEKVKNYVVFHTSRSELRERAAMDEKAAELTSKGFVRAHIGCLINMRYIAEIMPQNIRLTDGTLLPLSRKYSKEVRRQFFEWMVNVQ